MPDRRRRLTRAAVCCAAALLAAGCGTEKISTPPPPPPPASPPAALLWMEWEPRALDPGRTDSVTLTVALAGEGSPPWITPLQGDRITLRTEAPDRYSVRLAAADVLRGYRDEDDHHFFGFLEGTASGGMNLSVNVRTSAAADVPVRRLADDAQASPHVLNLRSDELYLGGQVPLPVTRRMYEVLPDSFDFVAVVEQVSSPNNRFYAGVRNEVRGIGLPLYDHTAERGSAGRLQGVVHYPLDSYFDLAERAAIHEIGHRWLAFLRPEGPFAPGSPHWPVSSAAYGIMGFSIPGRTRTGGDFPFRLVPDGKGNYLVRSAPSATEFNSLELYLMGLATPEEVERFVVLDNQDQASELRDGGLLRGPATEAGVQEVIAHFGHRVPAAAGAQKSFRLATVVLSRGRLLTPAEMAFFDHMAARGEARTELPYTSGRARGVTKPFFLATRGRATLRTRLELRH